MIKVIEERPVPRATAICLNCHSTLEYGNADLIEDVVFDEPSSYTSMAFRPKSYYFYCPVCGCKVEASWINKKGE